MTGFLPSRDGFAFPNSWPSQPALTLPVPWGRIGLGDAAGGLCGGMVYAALDHWYAGQAPPPDRPEPGDPLYRFIVRRLLDSWALPTGVLRYYRWQLAADADRRSGRPAGGPRARAGLGTRTVVRHWPGVRDELEAGRPVPLGVVTARGADVRRMVQHHQVLAWAYRREGALVVLQVYDPNRGPRDDVTIRFRDATPAAGTSFGHDLGIDGPVRGFFRTGYRPAPPPA